MLPRSVSGTFEVVSYDCCEILLLETETRPIYHTHTHIPYNCSRRAQSPSTPPMSTAERVVRFQSQCVLIPSSTLKRPKLSLKSYSLPLWKKGSDKVDHVVFKVPIPRSVSRFPTYPPRPFVHFSSSFNSNQPPSPQQHQPLPPCLVHRISEPHPIPPTYTMPPTDPHLRTPQRQPSNYGPSRPETTVPLRACCPDCYTITEESLREGDSWQERFSTGARLRHRRYSFDISRDSTPPLLHHRVVSDVTPLPSTCFRDAIVDEIDKRRRNSEEKPSVDLPTIGDHVHDILSPSMTALRRRHPPFDSPRPSVEDDEGQLFPLPSPRRSPSVSPAGSTSYLASPATDSSFEHSAPPKDDDGLACNLQMRFRLHSHSYIPSSSSDDGSHLSSNDPDGTALLTPLDGSPLIDPLLPGLTLLEDDPNTLEPPVSSSPMTTTTATAASPGKKKMSTTPALVRRRRSSSSLIARTGADILRGVGSLGAIVQSFAVM
jgi:hypothetical protein